MQTQGRDRGILQLIRNAAQDVGVVSTTMRPVSIVREVRWTSGPVCTARKISPPLRDSLSGPSIPSQVPTPSTLGLATHKIYIKCKCTTYEALYQTHLSHGSVQERSNFNITANLLIPRKTASFLTILATSLSTSNLLLTHRVCYVV